MEVTQADLRQQCAPQHDAFVYCVHAAGNPTEDAARCEAEKNALERCATATVQMVRSINEQCAKQYKEFESCTKGGGKQCAPQEEAFWTCARPFTETVSD